MTRLPIIRCSSGSPHRRSANSADSCELARQQLGTVGSGNHYVDLLEDAEGHVWIGVHFGSRGFGHRTATGFMRIAAGRPVGRRPRRRRDGRASLFCCLWTPPSGQDYFEAMTIAGEYAYAGREAVVERVRAILGASVTDSVHNHHNFAWREAHDGESRVVVRKGATPAFPGQRGFVGGSMGDASVILEGVDSSASRAALYSTVHGAGRVMSRTQAAGRRQRRTGKIKPGAVDWPAAQRSYASAAWCSWAADPTRRRKSTGGSIPCSTRMPARSACCIASSRASSSWPG